MPLPLTLKKVLSADNNGRNRHAGTEMEFCKKGRDMGAATSSLTFLLAAIVSFGLMTSSAWSAPGSEAPLTDRIEALEQEIAALKETTGSDKTDKKSLWSSLDVQFYGYIKADASHDSSRTTTGNYVVYVDSEATRKNDSEFNLTANETRLA